MKELCEEIEQCDQLIALRLEGNTINEAAATAIGQALEKHGEIEVKMKCSFRSIETFFFFLASYLE